MTDLPVAAFFSNASRTNAEAKQGQDDMLGFIRQMLGGQAESTLTLLSDAATPTRGTHAIDTEAAAASDDLANLVTTNLPDGSFLLIRAVSAARVVTVKHNAGGSGQMALFGAVDAVLDATSKWLLLKRTGANWEEVARFGFGGGGTITAGRGFSANANGTQGGTITGNGTLRIMGAVYESVAAATTTNLTNISNGTSALNITGNNVTITGFSGLLGLPDIPFKIGNGTLTLQTGGNLTIAAGNVTLDANSTGTIRPLTNTTAEIVGIARANGAALAGGGGGLTLIGQANFTNVANVNFTNNFTQFANATINILVIATWRSLATNNIRARISRDGSTFLSGASDYRTGSNVTQDFMSVSAAGGTWQANRVGNSVLTLSCALDGTYTTVLQGAGVYGSVFADDGSISGGGGDPSVCTNSVGALRGIQFYGSGGNISGLISLYKVSP
jgi:hypothetical protein